MVEEVVVVRTKMHMWWAWLRIAVRHTGEARRAREGKGKATSPESAEVALYAFVAGGVAIKRRGLQSLHIPSRKAGFGVVGIGFVAFIRSLENRGLAPCFSPGSGDMTALIRHAKVS
ncbi:MAG: hypothetical protein KY429_10645 [Actinobacteria bacterium]|nr:hypothetical protein [Actinomycetota bacterium]